ncbi:DUF1801 domain-containing protein [Blastococcus sp. TF02A-30]|nr:DUF1801 domain-containing protein [Blastococcus sp. TF02A-30]
MDDDAQTHLDGLDPEGRALFDRLHALVVAAHPGVAVVLRYAMPTYVVGDRQLHVGVWKHGLSLYGWSPERSGGFCDRYPALCGAKGTLRIPHADAARIPDEHLTDLVRAVLAP